MVQEFHVLKCYSCEAFQVHQVKKSKKWTCKMCGEKQSIIKVFGRGSGLDCRRHVQKLNTRRGEMLEEHNQRVWAQWEEADRRAEDEELGDGTQGHDGQDTGTATVSETQGSRWSKYLQKQGDVDPPEEEEDEDVDVVMNQRPGFRNIRKRKWAGGWEGGNQRTNQSRAKDTSPDSWRTAGISSKPPAHQTNTRSSAFTPMEKTSKAVAPFRPVPACNKRPSATPAVPSKPTPSASTVHKPPLTAASVPNRLNTTASQPGSSRNTAVSGTSRWAQFLTTPSPADDEEEEEEDENHWGFSASRNHEYQGEDHTEAPTGQPGCDASSLATLGDGGGLWKRVGTALNRLQSDALCGFGKAASSEPGPAHTASYEREEPVCHQPPPTKLPCPSLSLGSLFYSGEDFDDSF